MGQATESQVNMFRGIIALAWADHQLSIEEQSQLGVFIERNIHLSDAQRTQLLAEVTRPIKIADVWPLITDKHDRAHLINVAPVIFNNDGVYCETEKALYEDLEVQHLESIHADQVEQDIRLFSDELAKSRVERHLTRNADQSKVRTVLQYLGRILP